MEVKCPKCRFRYDTPVGAGITEVACVCPRCGTPFTYTVPDEADAPSTIAAGQPAVSAEQGVHATVPAQDVAAATQPQTHPDTPAVERPVGPNFPPGGLQRTPAAPPRRNCLRNCLVVFLIAFVGLVLAVRNCYGERSYKQAMLENGVNESLEEFGDGAVVSDADPFVEIHPEPIPDWLEGAWRVETDYGTITITIHGNKIAEESGGEISRGSFYYRQGRLYCDFGDGEQAIRKLNMKKQRIDAGDGMLMEKQ